MHLIELFELIENGENGQIEFKRKFSTEEKIAKEMIAFANTKGGKIIFGVDDNRRVIGVESEKGEIELIDMAAKFYCEPEINYSYDIVNIHRKDVIIVDVKESSKKPHRLIEQNLVPARFKRGSDSGNHNGIGAKNEKVYIRIKDKSVLASKETIKVLKKSNPDAAPLLFSLGEREKFLLGYLSNHDRITLKNFKKLMNISERRASRILVNLVRAELIRLHSMEKEDFYTLS